MNPIRVTALAVLAAASLLLVLDVLENLLATNWNGMAVSYLWGIIWPSSLLAVERFFENYVSAGLWHKVLLPILRLPAWATLLAIGLILFLVGKRYDD